MFSFLCLRADSTLFARVYGICHRDHTIVVNKRYQDSMLDIIQDKYFDQEIKSTALFFLIRAPGEFHEY